MTGRMNGWARSLALGAGVFAALLAGPISPVVAAPATAAAVPAHAAMAPTAAVVPNLPATSNRCVNATHTVPCWALTFHAGQGNQGCPNGVPLFIRTGGKACIGGNDLVLITCWFTGTPVVGNDNIQDHVTAEDAGNRGTDGHIPDFYIDLNNHNPGDPAIHIGHCA